LGEAVSQDHDPVREGRDAPLTEAKQEVIEAQYTTANALVIKALTFIKVAYDRNGNMTVPAHCEMSKKVLEHAARGEHFIMFDVIGRRAVNAINQRSGEPPIRPYAIRKWAKALGFGVGKEKVRFDRWPGAFDGRVISLDRSLAAMPVKKLDSLDLSELPDIDLGKLIDEQWQF
jgi:hypothetical protein